MNISELQPHQQRVAVEKLELDDKLQKLSSFIQDSPVFKTLPLDERGRLSRQHNAMTVYSNVLAERIAAFSHQDPQDTYANGLAQVNNEQD